MSTNATRRRAEQRAKRRAQQVGRAGYVTYGIVQLVLAFLTLQLAWGSSPQDASTGGAIATLAEPVAGQLLVWTVAVGMAMLAVWQAYVAATRQDGWTSRVAAGATGVAYAVVSVIAARFALGVGGAGSGGGAGAGDSGEQAASTLFALPGGVVLVGTVGLGIAGVGAFQMLKGATSGFTDDLSDEATDGRTGPWVVWLGRLGFAAKGAALVVVGLLFVAAAVTHDDDDAGGLDQALQTLKEQPAGPYLLTVVGVGFAAYGLYCFARARYERE
jgi:hypothetical protein